MMARSWPLRPRSLHADPCAGERVMVEAAHHHDHIRPISILLGVCC
ncbi:hypothetical protein GKD07_03700 [Lactobacillus rhamnosus]|nr:hypothetical protein [Lacticaseibacillus rhamnosus]MSB97281.1 hypothetical protein [Lacticaseibacillus rhamnosus]MSB99786.1 hypothetical protein [Lacticaseibacillus rhamnosus]MSC04643.1 hypothetical protein [Lacticaseibacillus rhamnosus]MSC05102.1 hypothetical protein [Lacticaseibacillus rhamnosus]